MRLYDESGTLREFEPSDILRIIAFKRDCSTIDQLCLTATMARGGVLTVNEHMSPAFWLFDWWLEFQLSPYCSHWTTRVVQPAFERCETIIYDRADPVANELGLQREAVLTDFWEKASFFSTQALANLGSAARLARRKLRARGRLEACAQACVNDSALLAALNALGELARVEQEVIALLAEVNTHVSSSTQLIGFLRSPEGRAFSSEIAISLRNLGVEPGAGR